MKIKEKIDVTTFLNNLLKKQKFSPFQFLEIGWNSIPLVILNLQKNLFQRRNLN